MESQVALHPDQKGFPVPDRALVRERILAKSVETRPYYRENFFRFCAATDKGKIIKTMGGTATREGRRVVWNKRHITLEILFRGYNA